MRTDRSTVGMALALALAVVVASCGGAQKDRTPRVVDFACKERTASYTAVGTLMYQQMGIRLSCEGNQPMVEQFFMTDDGSEKKASGYLSPGAWEKTWQAFDNAGWRNLRDCDNPSAGEREPEYAFEVADQDFKNAFTCQGNRLPFPYDTLQLALDAAAGELPSSEP